MAIRTADVPPSVSAPLPLACVAPPAQFGRLTQAVGDLFVEVSAGGLPGHPVSRAGYRPRFLSVALDDPVAAAWSLRNHMEPADLMKLIVILAEAAADVVRQRTKTQQTLVRNGCV